MTEPTFDLLFDGEIAPGRTLAEVKPLLARSASLTNEEFEERFAQGRVVLRSNIPRVPAERWAEAFLPTGAICKLVPSAASSGGKGRTLQYASPADPGPAAKPPVADKGTRLQFGAALPQEEVPATERPPPEPAPPPSPPPSPSPSPSPASPPAAAPDADIPSLQLDQPPKPVPPLSVPGGDLDLPKLTASEIGVDAPSVPRADPSIPDLTVPPARQPVAPLAPVAASPPPATPPPVTPAAPGQPAPLVLPNAPADALAPADVIEREMPTQQPSSRITGIELDLPAPQRPASGAPSAGLDLDLPLMSKEMREQHGSSAPPEAAAAAAAVAGAAAGGMLPPARIQIEPEVGSWLTSASAQLRQPPPEGVNAPNLTPAPVGLAQSRAPETRASSGAPARASGAAPASPGEAMVEGHTPAMTEHARQTKTWVMVCAVAMLAAAALSLGAGVARGVSLELLGFAIQALVLGELGRRLWQYAAGLRRAVEADATGELETAFYLQRRFWEFAATLYGLLALVAVIGLLAGYGLRSCARVRMDEEAHRIKGWEMSNPTPSSYRVDVYCFDEIERHITCANIAYGRYQCTCSEDGLDGAEFEHVGVPERRFAVLMMGNEQCGWVLEE